MILFKKTADLRKWLDLQQEKGNSTGFVPTMGALHAGHISLIHQSRAANLITVCSIFVNPTQFNEPVDFEKYPVTIEKDITLLEEAGCDVLFLPSVKEMYPDARAGTDGDDPVGRGIKAKMHYDLGYLETVLEGKYRPGHFQGVCMVVHRLLDIVTPSELYLGQKDYQQCMVITKLVELINPSSPVNVNICPTLREPGGLAMSSRNMRLDAAEREKATAIFNVLSFIKETLRPGELSALKQQARSKLEEAGFKVDYVEIAGALDLSLREQWDGEQKLVALVAAFINEIRLIDNMILQEF